MEKCCVGTVRTRETVLRKLADGRREVKVETFHSHDYNCHAFMVQWDVPFELPTDRIRLGRNA